MVRAKGISRKAKRAARRGLILARAKTQKMREEARRAKQINEHNYSLQNEHREESAPLLEENNSSSLEDEQIPVDEQMQLDEQIVDEQQEQSPNDEEIIVIICDDLSSEHQEKDVQMQRSDNMKNKQTVKDANDFNVSEIKKDISSPEIQQVEKKIVLGLKQKMKQLLQDSSPPKIQQVINEEVIMGLKRKLNGNIQNAKAFGIKQHPIPLEIQPLKNEKNDIDKIALQTETEQKPSRVEKKLLGRRTVDLDFVFEQIATISSHGPMNCEWKHMEFEKEFNSGLSSKLHFKCKMCGFKATLDTISPENQQLQKEEIVLAQRQTLEKTYQVSNCPEIKQVFLILPGNQQIINDRIDTAFLHTGQHQGPNKAKKISLSGRRIVDIAFVIEQISELSDHKCMNCGCKCMEFEKECREGLASTLYFQCKWCHYSATIKTIRDRREIEDRVFMGCLIAGIGLTQFEDICGALDMPMIGNNNYAAADKRVSERVSIAALKSMKEAAQEEAKICRELNSVDESGTPLLTVITDGAWSKRSYKTKYNAKSGVAAIIGAQTKKILYLGVRNTYCRQCMTAKSSKKNSRPHKCYLNWTGTSTSMESSILVEGFQKSMEMHGVIYDRLIADGDSSTMRHLQDAQPYGPNRQIKKIECKNHLLRNYCSKLKELTKNRTSSSNKMVPAGLRQQLKMKAMPLRSAVSSAIAFRKQEDGPISEQVEKLREDLLNGPSHVFGEHAKCIERGYFCQHEPVQGGIVEEMRQCGLFDDIMAILNRLLKHLDSLYMAQTNNICESYNSVVNKFVGGKRINFTQTGGYERRCFAAALHFNSKGRTILHDLQVDGEFTDKYIKTRTTSYNRIPSRRKAIDRKYLGADSDYGLVEDLEVESAI